mgnify:CR=1 FL=1|tara:strand:+ start:592 stop:801 length:210 start_codon:yes stop_codon:yes gene_type:complete
MALRDNKVFNKFKKLTTTSNIDEEKEKRVKSLTEQKEDTTAKELSNIMSPSPTVGDEEYQYFMKLLNTK